MRLRTWLVGTGLVAGLMYFLDADSGRRRRAQARDRVASLTHRLDRARGWAERSATYYRASMKGMLHETRARLRDEPVTDHVLVERVRSALGRAVRHPKAIVILADRGMITVSGQVLAEEVAALLVAVRAVRGVKGVQDRLEVHASPGHIPALQ